MQDIEHTVLDLSTRLEALNGKIDTVIANVKHLADKFEALSSSIDKMEEQFNTHYTQQMKLLYGSENGSGGLVFRVSKLQDDVKKTSQEISSLSKALSNTNAKILWFLISLFGGLAVYIIKVSVTGG